MLTDKSQYSCFNFQSHHDVRMPADPAARTDSRAYASFFGLIEQVFELTG